MLRLALDPLLEPLLELTQSRTQEQSPHPEQVLVLALPLNHAPTPALTPNLILLSRLRLRCPPTQLSQTILHRHKLQAKPEQPRALTLRPERTRTHAQRLTHSLRLGRPQGQKLELLSQRRFLLLDRQRSHRLRLTQLRPRTLLLDQEAIPEVVPFRHHAVIPSEQRTSPSLVISSTSARRA